MEIVKRHSPFKPANHENRMNHQTLSIALKGSMEYNMQVGFKRNSNKSRKACVKCKTKEKNDACTKCKTKEIIKHAQSV